MLMTLKNKILLSMDRLIMETKKKGGVPESIFLEPQEAIEFLREIKYADRSFRGNNITVKHTNNNDVDIRFLLQGELTDERLKTFVKNWHKKIFVIFFKGIELKVVEKKLPKAPLQRIIKENAFGKCKVCGSSLHTKWIFWNDGCIQPKCEKYYKKS